MAHFCSKYNIYFVICDDVYGIFNDENTNKDNLVSIISCNHMKYDSKVISDNTFLFSFQNLSFVSAKSL